MNKAVSNDAATNCGNCGSFIDPNSQFCAGCGQPLWQKCECGVMALLTQSFCNGCGSNLDEKLQARLNGFEKVFDRCQTLQNEGKFVDALRLIETATKPPDFRFKEVAEKAKSIAAATRELIEQWDIEIEKAQRRVERYLPANRFEDIIRILSRIPVGYIPADLAKVLEQCRTKTSVSDRCKADLKAALAEKNYVDAASCLSQLVELSPTQEEYKTQLEQVCARLLAKSAKYSEQARYQRAVETLQAIPSAFHDKAYLKLLQKCEEILLLRDVLAKSTYMNPLIPAVLDKLERLTKDDPAIAKLHNRLLETRKSAAKLNGHIWPDWLKPELGGLGLPIIPTRIPSSFPGERPDCLVSKGSQFFVALGLAAQAAQKLMPKGEFVPTSKPSGVMGFLATKKFKPGEYGIGVDIGDSSIKVLRLKYAGEPAMPRIDFATMIPLESDQVSGLKLEKAPIEAAVKKLLKELTIGGERVIVNYPGSDLVSRYLQLPPNSERKRFDDFILQDVRANIPVDMELLQIAFHVSDLGAGGLATPSGILMAARKQEFEFRKALLEHAGLKVDGMQPEPFALWCALQVIDSVDASALPVDEDAIGNVASGQSLADMLIDVGVHRTNIVISHPCGIWTRTIDWGTDDLSLGISKAAKLTKADADMIRRETMRSKYLQLPLQAMQSACHVPKREIERSAYAARDTIGDLRLRRVLLIGGGAYQPFLSSWLNGCAF